MATRVYIRVYDSRIMEMNRPGGITGKYIHNKGQTIERFAKVQAPKRSGNLARSINLGPHRWRGHRSSIEVSANARYAKWVHNGTYGPIYPTTHEYLAVPKFRSITGAKVPRVLRRTVDGQRPQPFLREALAFVMSGSRFIRTFGSGNV
jgi:hypothetical protein